MLLELFLNILGIVIFLTPGIFLGFILFPKINIVERTIFSLSLSIGSIGIISILLYFLGALNQLLLLLSMLLLILTSSLLIIFRKNNNCLYKTEYDKSILYIILFSLLGTAWKHLFIKSINNLSDPYAYSLKFVGKIVPDLGYYTGMALDKSKYIGTIITSRIFEFLYIEQVTETFLITFLFLGFVFLVFKEYRQDGRLAYLGVAVMAIGPIEIFYTTLNVYGHSLAYVSLLPLFLLFKSKNIKIFWIILLFSIVMTTTYYTSSITIILCCFGFLIALIINDLIKIRSVKKVVANLYKNKKFLCFLIIFFITLSYLFMFSKMSTYSMGRAKDFTDIKITAERLDVFHTGSDDASVDDIVLADTLYKDPTFLGLSAIRWQILFFVLCGFSFILYLILKRRFDEEEISLILCLIPIIIISYGFFHVNLPTRIFDYFAFFGLMNFRLPRKHFKLIFLIFIIFILISGFYVAKDRKVFLEVSREEIMAAKEIKNHLTGKIFSDETFINQLVLNDYYNVTGANDKDKIVENLFYQKDKKVFLDSISLLNNSGVNYVAITKRMREKYVLMVNYPQKPIFNFELYEQNLKEAYNNGSVIIYSTSSSN